MDIADELELMFAEVSSGDRNKLQFDDDIAQYATKTVRFRIGATDQYVTNAGTSTPYSYPLAAGTSGPPTT